MIDGIDCTDIKSIIFDQDGTFYPSNSDLARELRERTKIWLMQKLHLSRHEIDLLYEKLRTIYPNPYHGFQSLGASVAEYHAAVFNTINPCNYLAYDPRLIRMLRILPQTKYVVTLASPSYSEALQECLGIARFIEKTYYVSDFAPDYSKKRCYEAIAQGMDGDYSALCVIGDNFQLDIVPALELGCMTVYISNAKVSGAHHTIETIFDLPRAFGK